MARQRGNEPIEGEVVLAVRRLCDVCSRRALARRFGISLGAVSHICAGRKPAAAEPEIEATPIGRCEAGHLLVELPCRSCAAERQSAARAAGRLIGLVADGELIERVRAAVLGEPGHRRQRAEAAIAVYRGCVWRLWAGGFRAERQAEHDDARRRLVELSEGRWREADW